MAKSQAKTSKSTKAGKAGRVVAKAPVKAAASSKVTKPAAAAAKSVVAKLPAKAASATKATPGKVLPSKAATAVAAAAAVSKTPISKAALVAKAAAVKALTEARQPVVVPKPAPPIEGLKKKELDRFQDILIDKKMEILDQAKRTLNEDMTLDSDDLADEMDLASSEYLQSFTFRLRGREKTFLKKIDKALAKIDDGTFGICEECDELISIKRLEARPETTLCIRCKEDQERLEKSYG